MLREPGRAASPPPWRQRVRKSVPAPDSRSPRRGPVLARRPPVGDLPGCGENSGGTIPAPRLPPANQPGIRATAPRETAGARKGPAWPADPTPDLLPLPFSPPRARSDLRGCVGSARATDEARRAAAPPPPFPHLPRPEPLPLQLPRAPATAPAPPETPHESCPPPPPVSPRALPCPKP